MKRTWLTRLGLAIATLLVVALVSTATLVSELLFPGWTWHQLPLHAVMEAVGVLAALLLSGLLLQLPGQNVGHDRARLFVACGLIAVAVFDMFHAAVPAGNLFVWLHSMSLFWGGLLFSLVWLPWRVRRLHRRFLPALTAVAAVSLSAASLAFPDAIPVMVTEAEFTRSATVINLLGASFFLLATVRFTFNYETSGHREALIFASLSLLFGLSGILFDYSKLWDVQWWIWHLMRLLAYLLGALYVLHLFRHTQSMLEQSYHTLERLNAELE